MAIWPRTNIKLIEESGRFLKDYCFPNGVKIYKLPFIYSSHDPKVTKTDGSGVERLFKHWYG